MNHEEGLKYFLRDGSAEIDNNAAERALRGIAVGRKNWLFTGSDLGGETAANIYSLIETTKLLEIDPWKYLHKVLAVIQDYNSQKLDGLLTLAPLPTGRTCCIVHNEQKARLLYRSLTFKLHITINNKGEIMAIKITKGNKGDISVAADLVKGLQGSIYGDKGYISKKLFTELFKSGLRIFTGIRKDMKNHLLPNTDKSIMRKKLMNLEQTRHRSPVNFIVHILACITRYSLLKTIKLNKKLQLDSLILN